MSPKAEITNSDVFVSHVEKNRLAAPELERSENNKRWVWKGCIAEWIDK